MERSRKAAERADKDKAKAKARRENTLRPGVPEWIPDCVAHAYKPTTSKAAKRGKKSIATAAKTSGATAAKTSGATTTRRTAKEQANYEKTMTALDKMINMSAAEAPLEDEEEEEEENEDARPMTRGRYKRKD